MIAVGTNLLVYAHRSDSPFHTPARKLIESLRVQKCLGRGRRAS